MQASPVWPPPWRVRLCSSSCAASRCDPAHASRLCKDR
jgi:hypothetical protein